MKLNRFLKELIAILVCGIIGSLLAVYFVIGLYKEGLL